MYICVLTYKYDVLSKQSSWEYSPFQYITLIRQIRMSYNSATKEKTIYYLFIIKHNTSNMKNYVI